MIALPYSGRTISHISGPEYPRSKTATLAIESSDTMRIASLWRGTALDGAELPVTCSLPARRCGRPPAAQHLTWPLRLSSEYLDRSRLHLSSTLISLSHFLVSFLPGLLECTSAPIRCWSHTSAFCVLMRIYHKI